MAARDEPSTDTAAEPSASARGQVVSAAAIGPDVDAAVGKLRQVSADEYVVRGELARGGMGRILDAWDQRHQRPVAIKVLLRHGVDAVRRFLREATITARLQHPSIVPL